MVNLENTLQKNYHQDIIQFFKHQDKYIYVLI